MVATLGVLLLASFLGFEATSIFLPALLNVRVEGRSANICLSLIKVLVTKYASKSEYPRLSPSAALALLQFPGASVGLKDLFGSQR